MTVKDFEYVIDSCVTPSHRLLTLTSHMCMAQRLQWLFQIFRF